MPIPLAIGKLNRVVANPVALQVAGWMPGFGIVVHQGRNTGVDHHTPVNLFRYGQRWVIPLTYGRNTDWVKNVVAAGGCEVVHRNHRMVVTRVEIIRRTMAASAVPAPVRFLLWMVRVKDYLSLETR